MRKIFILFSSLCLIAFINIYSQNYSNELSGTINDSNLLKNGNFSDSLRGWLFIGQGMNHYHPEDPGRADFKVEDGVLVVSIKNSGNSIYSVMLYQPVLLKKDSFYSISFYAKSNSPILIISNLTQDVTWINFSGDREFELTGIMTKYVYKFKMIQTCELLFQFCFGAKGTSSIFIDGISLKVAK